MSEHPRPQYRRRVTQSGRRWPLFAAVGVLLLASLGVVLSSGVPSGGETASQSSVGASRAATSSTESSPPALAAAEPTQAISPEPTSTLKPQPKPEAPTKTGIVIAWQPAHQGDTGADGWKEYVICGDIVDRVIAKLPEYEHVKAWETGMGLTGSNNYKPAPKNQKAFDSELKMANDAAADVFISIHNDGGAPSGILGEYLPGDATGKALCSVMVNALVSGTGLKDRGMREVRLYSLEAPQNEARHKCLLEIGDNAADRAYLENPANRDEIAQALADGIRAAGLAR